MFTLTFSHIQDGKRVPLIENGQEVTKTVEAPTKSAAMMDQSIKQFCESKGGETRIRTVK